MKIEIHRDQPDTMMVYMKAVLQMCPDGLNPRHTTIGFIMQHGRWFDPLPKPKRIRWGVPKHCFMNAARLALNDLSLTYCEGYALGGIPLHHAWVADAAGTVIDNTWRTLGTGYFGVPFTRAFLVRRLAKQKYYGLLDQWPDLELEHMEDADILPHIEHLRPLPGEAAGVNTKPETEGAICS